MPIKVASTETPLRTERWSIPFSEVPEAMAEWDYAMGDYSVSIEDHITETNALADELEEKA